MKRYAMILTVIGMSLLLLCGTAHGADSNLAIWDGEDPTPQNQGTAPAAIDTANALAGQSCLRVDFQKYYGLYAPLSTLPSYRQDIGGYDEVWLLMKWTPYRLRFGIWGRSNACHTNAIFLNEIAAPYLQALPNGYRLLRIPKADLIQGSGYDLGLIETIDMSVPDEAGAVGGTVYIDGIWAVKLATVDPTNFPLIKERPIVTQDFGMIRAKAASTKTITITNVGNGPLNITDITSGGTELSANPTSCTIASGASRDISITFIPKACGDRSETLRIHHNSTLWGDGTAIPVTGKVAGPLIEVYKTVLTFKTIIGHNIQEELMVKNIGTEDLVLTNTASGAFTVSQTTLTIAPGEIAPLGIIFTPAGTGTVSGTLTITTNEAADNVTTVALAGEGVAQGTPITLPITIGTVTSSTIPISIPMQYGIPSFYIGPEPSAVSGNPLPLQKAVIPQYDPGSDVYRITDISAATDVFIHIEIKDIAGKVVTQANAHAKTKGGPGKPGVNELDTPLQEAHLASPKILMLVMKDTRVRSSENWTEQLGDDFTGPRRQAASWTVTRSNGTVIPVTAVYRNSLPAGHGSWDNNYLDVVHCLYLVLGQEVGNREILEIRCQSGDPAIALHATMPFSDYYTETPVIQVNQVGYAAQATERYAYISWWMGDGNGLPLVDFLSTADVLIEPPDSLAPRPKAVSDIVIGMRNTVTCIDPETGYDPDVKAEVRDIDLSAVPPAEGIVYRVRIPRVGVSWPTQVSNTAVFKAFYTTIRGMYLNRWGRDLQPQWTEWCTRPPDHATIYTQDTFVTNSGHGVMFDPNNQPPLDGARPMTGGHHDAADYDQQMNHYLFAFWLLEAYEANPAAFADGQLTIPESGNDIPDILDEALYEIKAWEELQDYGGEVPNPENPTTTISLINYEPAATRTNDGGVRQGVESYNEGGDFSDFADEDPTPYWTYAKDGGHSARIAAVFAKAARIMRPFDHDRSLELWARALKADEYGRSHAAVIAPGYNGDPHVDAEQGNVYAGNILFADSELLALTDSIMYKNRLENDLALYKTAFGSEWGVPNIYGNFYNNDWRIVVEGSPWRGMQYSGNELAGYLSNPQVQQENGPDFTAFMNKLNGFVESDWDGLLIGLYNDHGHRTARGQGNGGGWGQVIQMGTYMEPIYARLGLSGSYSVSSADRQRYINALSLAADNILGCNPAGIAWITGLGSRYPLEPTIIDGLNFLYQTDKGMMPGTCPMGPMGGGFQALCYYAPSSKAFYPSIVAHDPYPHPDTTGYPLLRSYADARSNICTWEASGGIAADHARLFARLLPTPALTPPESWLPFQPEHRNTLPPRGGTVSNPPPVYIITASAGAKGSISPQGSVSVDHGANMTFTITPNAGYAIDAVVVDGLPVGAVTTYTFANVTQARTIAATFKALATPPAAPTNLAVTAKTKNTISVKWTDNAANETGYEVEWSKSSSFSSKTTASLAANTTAYKISGLKNYTKYYIRVRAKNAAGYSGYSNIVNARTNLF